MFSDTATVIALWRISVRPATRRQSKLTNQEKFIQLVPLLKLANYWRQTWRWIITARFSHCSYSQTKSLNWVSCVLFQDKTTKFSCESSFSGEGLNAFRKKLRASKRNLIFSVTTTGTDNFFFAKTAICTGSKFKLTHRKDRAPRPSHHVRLLHDKLMPTPPPHTADPHSGLRTSQRVPGGLPRRWQWRCRRDITPSRLHRARPKKHKHA